MPITALRLLAVLTLLPFMNAAAQQRALKQEAEPAWVTNNIIDYNNQVLDHEAEEGVIDVAYEKQVSIKSGAVYTKKIIKLLSEAGVQNSSEISVAYDPSYQQLLFHKINIIRQGVLINKLQLSKFKVVQQEKELNQFIYNGDLTAVLFLEDVQPGDIIEYSYTIKGFNPIFGGRYSGVFDVGFSVPIYHIYYKVLNPDGMPFHYKNSKTHVEPVISKAAGNTCYEWRLDNVPALHAPDHLPSWYDPYAVIMVSAFNSWKEVNDWALRFYPLNHPLTPALKAKVQEIKNKTPDAEGQVSAALRFVQDDIRYMGIEMGQNSHKPHAPGQVLQQRFGDCKDKSYLLCTILRNLGIDASPVFLDTDSKQAVKDMLPAPTVFDHVTVRVNLNNKVYYFDPTISFQRGPIDAISFPDYKAGLVITDTTTGLVTIPFKANSITRVKETFNMKDMLGKANFKVVTTYTGAAADNIRNDFKSTSRYELSNTYKNYYQYYFKNIKGDSLVSNDNESTGVFTTTEYYTIDSLWGKLSYAKKADFEPYVINSILKRPKDDARSMPYNLGTPAHYTEEIEINLPEKWSLKNLEDEKSSDAFKWHTKFTCSGEKLVLKYDFEYLKDHLMPDEMESYSNVLQKADEGLGYTLTWNKDMDTGASATNFEYAELYVILGICVFITYNLRKRNKRNSF